MDTTTHTLRLYKRQKLCSLTAIDLLFARQGDGQAALLYPLRIAWRHNDIRTGGVQFMISVPKRKLRHAVDRVTMRRRIREAYRLHHRAILGNLTDTTPIDIAFIYVADQLVPSRRINSAMIKALKKIAASAPAPAPATDPQLQ